MSANLDLVRSIFADWERGDFSRSDWADPEIEYVIADGPDPGTVRGREGMARRAGEELRPATATRLAAKEIKELDRERVLVLISARSRGKSSGVEIDYEQVQVFDVHAGMVTRLVVYYEPDRAFADLGLTPEGQEPSPAMPEEPTTPDLVELTRQCFEVATRLDLDSMISLYDRDRMAWDVRPMGLGLYEGEAAVRAFAEEFLGTFEDYRAEVLDIEDIGNGVVNVVYHQEGRMPGGGPLVTARAALVYEWRDGLIVRMTSYIDIDEARAAAERLAEEEQ